MLTQNYKTTDTAFAAFLSWKKDKAVVATPKECGRSSFLVLGTTVEEGARLWQEYQKTEYFEFDTRRRALTQQIPGS